MRVPAKKKIFIMLIGVVGAAALVMVGRLTADTTPTHGSAQPVDQSDEYFDGLQVGEAQGRREGRAIQEGAALPAGSRRPVQDAFDAGYAAGTNDAFAGYDGGWAIGLPYVVTIAEGTGDVAYRIKTRDPIEAGVNYYLCPSGHDLCQEHR
jgi:hypothetical protein